jgi:hypothetical protein
MIFHQGGVGCVQVSNVKPVQLFSDRLSAKSVLRLSHHGRNPATAGATLLAARSNTFLKKDDWAMTQILRLRLLVVALLSLETYWLLQNALIRVNGNPRRFLGDGKCRGNASLPPLMTCEYPLVEARIPVVEPLKPLAIIRC